MVLEGDKGCIFCISGMALMEVGETFKQLSEIKNTMDDDVQLDFLYPIQQFCDKNIQETIVSIVASA